MKVGILTPVLEMGGVEQWVLSLLRHCPSIEWSGVAVTSRAVDGKMLDLCGRRCPVGIGPLAVQAIKDSSDVILCWGNFDLGWHMKGYGGRLVFVSHGSGGWTRHLAREAVGVATDWVAVSKSCLDVLPAEARATAALIHNGVDAARVIPHSPREYLYQAWDIDSSPVYLCVSRFRRGTGYLAAAYAARETGGCALYVGSPGADEPDAKKKIKAASQGRYVILDQWAHVGDAMAAADVFISAREEDGYGLATVEALLAGVPVVSTREGIVREIAELRPCEWIDKHWTAESVARACDDAMAGDYSMAQAYAREYLTVEVMADRWSTYLNALCRNRNEIEMGYLAHSKMRRHVDQASA